MMSNGALNNDPIVILSHFSSKIVFFFFEYLKYRQKLTCSSINIKKLNFLSSIRQLTSNEA